MRVRIQIPIYHITSAILLATTGAVLLVFWLLARYSHPSADDYYFANFVFAFNDGIVNTIYNQYMNWTGGYSAIALYLIYPKLFGLLEGYKFVPILLMISMIATLNFLLATLFRKHFFNVLVLATSFMIFISYLLCMPSTTEGFYWLTGALGYQVGNIATLLLLALAIRLHDKQAMGESVNTTVSLMLVTIFIGMGTNETSVVGITGAVLFLIILHAHKGMAILRPWIVILTGALVCFAVVYFAPGNDVRLEGETHRIETGLAIAFSWVYAGYYIGVWTTNPVLLTSSIIFLILSSRLIQESGREISGSIALIALGIACVVIAPTVLEFPAWWAGGRHPPPRVTNVIFFAFITCWYLALLLISNRLLCGTPLNIGLAPTGATTQIILLMTTLGFTSSAIQSPVLQEAIRDLSGRAASYSRYLHDRYSMIEHAVETGDSSLNVPPYDAPLPVTVYYSDITDDPEDFRNSSTARFFGLDALTMDSGEK